MCQGVFILIHSKLSVDFYFRSFTIANINMAHNNGAGRSTTDHRRGLASTDHAPVLDEQTIKKLGEEKVEGFYDRLEKTIHIIHASGNGTERQQG